MRIKPLIITFAAIAVLVGGFYALNAYIYHAKQAETPPAATDDGAPGDTLTGGGWTWAWTAHADGSETLAPEGGEFVLSFDEDGRMASATDCNTYTGTYTADGDALSFGAMASTKMFCEGSREADYAAMLTRAEGFAIGDGELHLTLADGGTMVFVR